MWWALAIGADLLWEAKKGKLEGKLPIWMMDLIDIGLTGAMLGVGGSGVKASIKSLSRVINAIRKEKKAKDVLKFFLGGADLGGNLMLSVSELNELPREITDLFRIKERSEFVKKKEMLINGLKEKEMEKLYELKRLEVQMRSLDTALSRIRELKEKKIEEEEKTFLFEKDYLNFLEKEEE